MKEIMRTVTQKGQVTIPLEIRNLLGLKIRDKVIFKICLLYTSDAADE